MILILGVLLVLCISSATSTEMCAMSATRISCSSRGTSSLLSQCNTEKDTASQFGVLADAIRQFIPHVRSQQCRKQLLTFTDELTNSSLWAIQMLDASAKTVEPGGYSFGHFDECIDINLKRNGDNVRGKYCLADVSESAEFGRSRMGICVPNECGHRDVRAFIERYLSEMGKDSVAVRISEDSCVTKGNVQGRAGSTLLKYGVVGLVLWSVLVTILDLISINWEGSTETWRNTVDVFSCYRNIRKLTSTNAGEGLSGIHFLRVATIFVIIIHQRHQLMTEEPVKNRSYLQKVSLSPWPIFDALIFLAGFLTVQRIQSESLTDTKWKCFLLCVSKWLRIIPLYAGVIAFYAVAFEGIGNGPMWTERIGRESRRCADFWWANLSLVNNYISATGQCIAQSWYLAVTSHGFVVTLIFTHLKTGKAFVGLGSLAVSLTMSLVLFLWNDNAKHRFDRSSPAGDFYIKTQYRLPSFLLGAVSALIYYHIRQYKDRTTWLHFLTPFIVTTLGFVSILCHRLDSESKIMLAVVSSLTWSVFIGFIVIIFPLYNIRVSMGTFLKSVFISLSRLSYPALFSHNVVQLYLFGSMRTPEYVTFLRLVWMGAADIFTSYASALLLHLIIDGPVVSAVKIVFWSKEKKIAETAEDGTGKK